MSDAYMEFLRSKELTATARGMNDVPALSGHLFPFQRACVDHLLRVGSGGLFLDTGLGKTLCQLEWAERARNAATSNGYALILTPLAVTQQIAREGVKFGYPAHVIRSQNDAREGINVANYDRLHLLDPHAFSAVSLDESSILKSFTGKTTRALIEAFAGHRWKLSATATPAPNDHMELGQHAEFCGIMQSNEMLSRFFINDASTASQQWRLKHHAVRPFWDWMASWCRMAQLPSDLGDSDDGFILPPIEIIRHRADDSPSVVTGGLFGDAVVSATTMHTMKRATSENRAAVAAGIVRSSFEPMCVWVDTDYEADSVMAALNGVPGVVEVRGSMTAEKKEDSLAAFADGTAQVLVTKPSICGFGLNRQHCAQTVFVGRTFSYESWYQAVRRFWRFGQQSTVRVHLIVAEGEDTIARVIDRKADDHDSMKREMREAMRRNMGITSQAKVPYQPKHEGRMPAWFAA